MDMVTWHYYERHRSKHSFRLTCTYPIKRLIG